MDSSSLPGSPTGGPLQAVTPDRINRRDSIFSSLRSEGGRDSSVHEKINQFNNLSIALQSKQMERKTADAALTRAMVGREEAEAEIRRLREESKGLRKHLEEGKERERKVGERLEAVMVVTLSPSYSHFFYRMARVLTHRNRTTTDEPKRHIHTHKPYGRRKSDEQEKKTSRTNPQSSSCRRNSSLREVQANHSKRACNTRRREASLESRKLSPRVIRLLVFRNN